MRTVIGLAAALMLGAAPPGGSASVDERMFDRLKMLTGDWEGTFEWSPEAATTTRQHGSAFAALRWWWHALLSRTRGSPLRWR